MRWLCLVAAVLAVHAWGCASAQDYAREKRWADEIVPTVVVGEPIWLQLRDGHKFLNLYAAAPTKTVAILLVHGMGVHPDHGVIGILRSALNQFGYATFSAQMPVARSDAKSSDYYPALFPQAAERIDVSARYLRENGYKHVVLLSHSMGAWMLNAYLVEKRTAPFSAWVVLGRSGSFQEPSRPNSSASGIDVPPDGFRFPILDIYGENDLAPVLNGASARAAAIAHAHGSEQLMILGADHYYTGREQELTQAIQRFVAKTIRRGKIGVENRGQTPI